MTFLTESVLTGNSLLDGLPEDELTALLRSLRRVELAYGEVLHDGDAPIDECYFPVGAVLSVVFETRGGVTIEVATIGRSGCCGAEIIIDGAESGTDTVVHIPGGALRIARTEIERLLPFCSGLAAALAAEVRRRMRAYVQTIACNTFHTVSQRCARRLLTARDQFGNDAFFLTQDHLALMLGVTRPSVSIAAGGLAEAGLLDYRRGQMTIRDVGGLERASCECYGALRMPPPRT